MYHILEAELRRKNVTRKMLATILNTSTNTVSSKLSGKKEFTFGEVSKIKNFLEIKNIGIKELFKYYITFQLSVGCVGYFCHHASGFCRLI